MLQSVMLQSPQPELELRTDKVHCGKDTGVFDDDVSCSLMKHHLIEDVDNLTHKLIILLLGYIQQTQEHVGGRLQHKSFHETS